MRPDVLKPLALVTSAALSGWLGWSGHYALLPVSGAFPIIWSLASSRVQVVGLSAAYFLAASRGLPQGVATFYASDVVPGIALWLIASTSFVFVHTLAWERGAGRSLAPRYLLALLLMAVPPFGILGWANPLAAAGVVFPGWGWGGLGAMATALALLTTRFRVVTFVVLASFWMSALVGWSAPRSPQGWHAINLTYGASLGRDTSMSRHKKLAKIARDSAHEAGSIAVLPESALGFWSPAVSRLWQESLARSGLTVLAGAASINHQGYDNVIVAVSEHTGFIAYRQRMPVPGSMWRPWASWTSESGGAKAHFFASPIVDLGTTRIAPIICYEQLLVWPILQSVAKHPDIIVAIANSWWTRGTAIVDIQRVNVEAWGRLFDIPIVMAVNR